MTTKSGEGTRTEESVLVAVAEGALLVIAYAILAISFFEFV